MTTDWPGPRAKSGIETTRADMSWPASRSRASSAIETSLPVAIRITSVPGASADIATQTASLQSDVNGVKVFPIFSFGLSYKIGQEKFLELRKRAQDALGDRVAGVHDQALAALRDANEDPQAFRVTSPYVIATLSRAPA